ncbi:MAG: hypothetical protein AB1397_01780 [bacterium]
MKIVINFKKSQENKGVSIFAFLKLITIVETPFSNSNTNAR